MSVRVRVFIHSQQYEKRIQRKITNVVQGYHPV
jgi:hypothetical protein